MPASWMKQSPRLMGIAVLLNRFFGLHYEAKYSKPQ